MTPTGSTSHERSQAALRQSLTLAGKLTEDLAKGLLKARIEGQRFDTVLTQVLRRVSDTALKQALAPINGAISGSFAGQNGPQGRPAAALSSAAQLFGLLEPAFFGPASRQTVASIPTTRTSQSMPGGSTALSPINVTVVAQDPTQFARSESQIAASLARAVRSGQRYL